MYQLLVFLYTRTLPLSIWIILLTYIDDTIIVTCHCQDEMQSSLSSILDHLPNVVTRNIGLVARNLS
jgi:hypothetical protein